MKMNPEIKAQWVAALRSGDYIQGPSFLAAQRGDNPLQHCCLGVLCEVLQIPSRTSVVVSGGTQGNSALTVHQYGRAGVEGVLPEEALAKSGLIHPNPVVSGIALSVLNDGMRPSVPSTFRDIAALIEKYL